MSNDLAHQLLPAIAKAQWKAAKDAFYRDLPRGEMPHHLLVELRP